MVEYIEREALKNDIANSTEPFNTGSVFRAINRQPSADVSPVRHGEWEIVVGSNGKEYMVCTCCRVSQYLTGVFTYCPNCGCRMDGGED